MERDQRGENDRPASRDFVIRDLSPGDYAVLAAIRNRAYPEYPRTPEDLAADDDRRSPKLLQRRWLAEIDGVAVGFGGYVQFPWDYSPGRFYLVGAVDADLRRRGIGSALYDRILGSLREHHPTELCGRVKERDREAGDFLAQRGFSEAHREYDTQLDVAAFDSSRFEEALRAVAAEGIMISNLTQLGDDPRCRQKLYDLYWEAAFDEPVGSSYSRPPLEEWAKLNLDHADNVPGGYFVAVKDGRYLGLAHLRLERATGHLIQGMTGVARDWRRRGIATALKVKTAEYARQRGYTVIKTGNDSRNLGMLKLNRRLGFQPTVVWIQMDKEVETTDPNGD